MNEETDVERLSLVVCAFRWDMDISTEEFVDALNRLIEAARREDPQ